MKKLKKKFRKFFAETWVFCGYVVIFWEKVRIFQYLKNGASEAFPFEVEKCSSRGKILKKSKKKISKIFRRNFGLLRAGFKAETGLTHDGKYFKPFPIMSSRNFSDSMPRKAVIKVFVKSV